MLLLISKMGDDLRNDGLNMAVVQERVQGVFRTIFLKQMDDAIIECRLLRIEL